MSACRVHVGNLDPQATQEELQAEVTRYCQPISVWVARNPPGFAFIELASMEDGEAVVHNLNGLRLRRNDIKVEFAKNQGKREPPPPRPAPKCVHP
jgi:RNA recognition motif-containing protein